MRFFLGLCCLLAGVVRAQDLPADRRVDWAGAGYPGCVPAPGIVLDAARYGVSPQNVDNAPALTSALAALGGRPGVVLVAAGTYRFRQTVALPSGAVLRGTGSNKTRLTFDFGGATDRHAITGEAPQTEPFTALASGYAKGSRTVETTAPLALAPGEYAEIRQRNGAWDTRPAPWAQYAVGQLVRVTAVAGTRVTIEKPLRIGYDSVLRPEMRRLVPLTDVGVESLTIERTDSPASGGGSNVSFQYAARCWLRGVESIRSIGSHVLIDASTQIEITGNYFHHALTYDGASTRGYGVTLIQHAGECLVENNVLETLRHALMAKQGANGNVFAYNYSTDPRRTETPTDGGSDLSLHGHYPFANLFEGNIGQTLFIDQVWGPAGPGNTFLRNRLERYGILMSAGEVPSDGQNFVGNEVTGTSPNFGNFLLSGTGHFNAANQVRGTWQPAVPTAPPGDSQFRTFPWDFWDAAPWPSLGPPIGPGTGTNPAQRRYRAPGPKTSSGPARPPEVAVRPVPDGYRLTASPARSYAWSTGQTIREITVAGAGTYELTTTNDNGCATRRAVVVTGETTYVVPFPNPSDGRSIRLRDASVRDVRLVDVAGWSYGVDWALTGDACVVTFRQRLPPGAYLLRLHTDAGWQTQRFVVR